ncbi:unnamed protein product [Blepharisma stoltei]|uniref:C2H2-type domain-containing protein n=1 Tax=Blepharisma stoltei TaxID=1481888 RepID=A0AAU9IDZ7_9CILI|nr:unnamed protein product [Blepharisma stoltei]
MKGERVVCTVQGCHRSYSTQANLEKHYEAEHGSVRRYQCEICKHYLSSKQNLNEHLLKHTGEKPFVCKVLGCGKSFRQGSQLSLHNKMHREVEMRLKDLK